MELDSPVRLLPLGAVLLVAGAYVLQQVRRSALRRRWVADPLVRSAVPRRPGALRHLPAALVLLGLVAMTVSYARPRVEREVERERATVVVALDTSTSMLAEDVAPDRFTAAKAAAAGFVEDLPDRFDVALVGFNGTATLHVPPTSDHAAVTRALAGLELSGGTAMGDALLTALSALRTPEAEAVGAVVLLADGGSTAGSPLESAVEQAADAQVPVTTIAYGTAEGEVVSDGQVFEVPVDEQVLAEVARGTGAQAYTAATQEQLSGVYDSIRTRLSTTTERQDVAAEVAGLALVLLLSSGAAALVDRRVHSVA